MLRLRESVARVAIVVDAVLLFQLQDVVQRSLRVRAGDAVPEWFASVQQDLFEATGQAHALVPGEIVEQSGEALLQSHRNTHALDRQRRFGARKTMSEAEMVTLQVAHGVVSQSLSAVLDRHRNLDAFRPVKIVQLVGVTHHEIDRATLWIGRVAFQEDLRLAEVDAREARRLSLHKGRREPELRRVELDRRANVVHGEARVVLFAVDARGTGWRFVAFHMVE